MVHYLDGNISLHKCHDQFEDFKVTLKFWHCTYGNIIIIYAHKNKIKIQKSR